ncbi:MAG: hypothetical protein JXP73_04260 [Deltaproteobacteria bacterium]|nr:hypothetical protein [Deltaproteobacteria bacterium]
MDSADPQSPATQEEPAEATASGRPLAGRIAARLDRPRLRKAALGTLFLVGWTWLVVRFLGLELSPPGFFMDEATPAVHAMCLAQTGKNLDAQPWPLYSHAAGGGHHPITLLVFDIVWTKFFGTSRGAFRAVSAFFILLTCVGLFLLARELAARISVAPDDERSQAAVRAFPWLVLFAALLSPWGFQFSRVGWEAPLAPAFLVLALVALLRGLRVRKQLLVWSILAGVGASAAMVTYPPLRATAPLVFVAMVALLWLVDKGRQPRWDLVKGALVTLAVTGICMLSTLRMLGQGKINERMNNIAIWCPAWVQERIGGTPRWLFYVQTFLDNVVAYLRPSFLFFTGDQSMRHSPRIIGELSPVDTLALLLVAGAASSATWRMLRGRGPSPLAQAGQPSPAVRWLVGIALGALLGCFFGVVPAALTYDALPNALRAIAAWPFIALFSGTVLAIACARRRWVTPALALVSLSYTLCFFPAYFRAYDKAEGHWFMREMTDLLDSQRKAHSPTPPEKLIEKNMAYSYRYYEVPMYYLMTEARMGCRQAKDAALAYRR